MGGGPSREEVDELRDDMISTFDSQRILLFGRYGAGKSSIINTFNHVTNLVQHDVKQIAAIAEEGSSEADTKTRCYTVYGTNTAEAMYEYLKESKIGELRTLFTKAPEFIDTPGIPPSVDRKLEMMAFYKKALKGDVATGFNLQEYYKSVNEKYSGRDTDGHKTMSIEPASEAAKKPWAVVAVLAAQSTDDKNTTQLAFLNDLKKANDSLNQGKDIKMQNSLEHTNRVHRYKDLCSFHPQ